MNMWRGNMLLFSGILSHYQSSFYPKNASNIPLWVSGTHVVNKMGILKVGTIFWYITPCSPLKVNRLHSVIYQKIVLFITIAVRTSNTTWVYYVQI
jgi:hypothetical protein